jgi:hypothetical protein
VTPSYLQTVLGVQEGHARNLIPMLKAIGLIGEDDRPTALANEWRTDEGYRDACARILEMVYPAELRDAVPPDESDRQAAKRWFMRGTGVGEVAAARMASFYTLLSQADPQGELTLRSRPSDDSGNVSTKAGRKRAISDAQQKIARTVSRANDGSPAVAVAETRPSAGPSVHIDVQIHIPSDATAEQIDAIFASMAKHLYRPQ